MKLSPLAYLAIGVSIGLSAFVYAWFNRVGPDKAEAEAYEKRNEELDMVISQMPMAKRRVKDTETEVNRIAGEWQKVVATNTPPIGVKSGGIDLSVNRWQLTNDSLVYRNTVQRAINHQVRVGGVKIVGSGPLVPFPSTSAADIVESFYNYPALGFPVVVFELGTITVRGTFEQIAQNVEAWKDMPNYLATTSSLAITGTSPNLTGTYRCTVIGFIRGKDIFPPVPDTSGTDQQGSGAPAPGGGTRPGRGTPPAPGGGAAPGGAGGPGALSVPGKGGR